MFHIAALASAKRKRDDNDTDGGIFDFTDPEDVHSAGEDANEEDEYLAPKAKPQNSPADKKEKSKAKGSPQTKKPRPTRPKVPKTTTRRPKKVKPGDEPSNHPNFASDGKIQPLFSALCPCSHELHMSHTFVF